MSQLRKVPLFVRDARREVRKAGSLRAWLLSFPGLGPRAMSWLRRRWVIFRHPGARIEFQGGVYLGPGFSLDAPRGGTFIVGSGVQFRRGFRAELADSQTRIRIGEGTVFTYDTLLQCTTSIDIGAHCALGQAALVVDGNHRFRELGRPMFEQGYDLRPVVIADHAVIASKSSVVGANIGERTYVSANTLVTRDLPAYSVAAGVPARIIEYFGPPEQEPRVDRGLRAKQRSG